MSNLSNLTYETLLAYVLPAAIVELIFLPLFSDRLNLQWNNTSAGYLVLGFLSVSIVVGLVFNMWGTIVTTKIIDLQRRKRNLILFGEFDRPTLLFQYMKTLYPNEIGQSDKVELVYAIFNCHVAEHIYSRRNWDWFYYQAGRNIFATFPLSITGLILLAIQQTWSVTMVIGVFSVAVVIFALAYNFMLRQLEIYYGYYAAVVLGHLLDQLAQTNGARKPIVEKKKDRLRASRFEKS